MKIRNKFLIGTVLTILIFSIAGVFVYYEEQKVSNEVKKAEIAQEILRDRISRRALMLEYLTYREERPKEQWYLLRENIEKTRSEYNAVFEAQDEQTVIAEINRSTDFIDVLFERLVAHYEAVSKEEVGDYLLADQFERALTAQIETESLLNTQRAQQLVFKSLENIKRAQKELLFVVVVSVAVLFSFLAALFLFFSRFIAKPLQTLTAVTKRFTTGNLGERIDVLSNDEIGELSTAFNTMAVKLQEMYVGLEKKVHDRTQDLEKSRNQLAKLTERFIFATHAARIGVWEWDVVRNVLTWDEQMYALYGIKKEDFGGAYEAWQKGLHPDDKQRGDEETKLALEGAKDFNMTFRVVWPNKEIHDIRAFASVDRDAEGKPLRMVGVNWDVTREMEVDKAKSEFVSLASHQLRTPLSTINWYAEMLASGDAGALTEKQHEFLKEIYVGSQRMVGLVNALLNVSRLELGRLTVDPSPTDLPALAKTIIVELKPILEKNQLTLTEQYAKSLPIANVDPKLVSIIFQNLLTNAVKYTTEKGVISFSIAMKKAGESFGNHAVATDSFAISVKDTGIGIPSHQQSAMFTKLFRADNARERDQDGTGLGLYLVKEIVDLAGGEVWYDSVEGKGSTFYVLLPVEGMKKSFGKTSLK